MNSDIDNLTIEVLLNFSIAANILLYELAVTLNCGKVFANTLGLCFDLISYVK